jgi:hypothetical protein
MTSRPACVAFAVLLLALGGPRLSADAKDDQQRAKSGTAVDMKEIGRSVGKLGQEIKQAGHKFGEGVKEGSRSKAAPSKGKRAGRRKAAAPKPATTAAATPDTAAKKPAR